MDPAATDKKDYDLNYKVWLSTPDGKGIMGDGKWRILQAIDEHGSLKAATKALGITYRRTWGDLKKIEKQLGFPLLKKTRGGKEGGQTRLTPEGRKLVDAFSRLHKRVHTEMEAAFREFREELD